MTAGAAASDRRNKTVCLIALGLHLLLFVYGAPYPRIMVLHHLGTVALALPLLADLRYGFLRQRDFYALAAFTALHIVAARWLYSYVPYDQWSLSLFGGTLSDAMGWKRNHFDRLVHFSYGLLFAPMIRHGLLTRTAAGRRHAGYLALEFIVASSVIYEFFEWGLAVFMSPEAAEGYNGQQGDIWDAHKDMALATLGAMSVLGVRGLMRRLASAPLAAARAAG